MSRRDGRRVQSALASVSVDTAAARPRPATLVLFLLLSSVLPLLHPSRHKTVVRCRVENAVNPCLVCECEPKEFFPVCQSGSRAGVTLSSPVIWQLLSKRKKEPRLPSLHMSHRTCLSAIYYTTLCTLQRHFVSSVSGLWFELEEGDGRTATKRADVNHASLVSFLPVFKWCRWTILGPSRRRWWPLIVTAAGPSLISLTLRCPTGLLTSWPSSPIFTPCSS